MVLLVDDDPVFLDATERTLTEAGFRVIPVNNGRLALVAARSVRDIKVVVLDLDLPDIPGIIVLGELRAARPDLKIVAVTGVLPRYTREIAMYLGADETFAKPMSRERLTAIATANAPARSPAAWPARLGN